MNRRAHGMIAIGSVKGGAMSMTTADRGSLRPRIGLFLGPLLALVMLLSGAPAGMEAAAWSVGALALWMAVWWVTEAVPVPVTALLPILLLPLLDVSPITEAAAPYANPLIFLFLGGFLIARAIERWNLHRRIALQIVHFAGQRPDRLVAGFMLATAFLSMWISNTATAAMMLPIGLSVIALLEGSREASVGPRFAVALLLGIAFGANIGGMGTLIGTPPNALLAAFMAEAYGVAIGFGQWMMVGVPVAALILVLAWWLLVRVAFPLGREDFPGLDRLFEERRAALGPLSGPERRVLVVFVAVAMTWMTRPLIEGWLPGLALSDPGIALAGAMALFLLPSGRIGGTPLLDWSATRDLPWGVLILVGGGLSLGTAIEASGLSAHIADGLVVLKGWPLWLVVGAVALLAMLLSHVTSNTATAATLLPLAAGVALTLEQPPLLLAVPVVLAASCAFMLPVATPPNAIVFGSERLTIPDMLRGGALIGLVAIAIIIPAVFFLALPLLGG